MTVSRTSASKQCTRCRVDKAASSFSKRSSAKDGLQSCCKSCQAEMDRKNYRGNADRRGRILESNERRRLRQTQRVTDIKAAAGCADCGVRDPVVLEFDHVTAGDKVADIATMTKGPWSQILAEISKCEVVCANCHRRRTWLRRRAK